MTIPTIPELHAVVEEAATNDSERLATMLTLSSKLLHDDPQESLTLATESLKIADRLGDEHGKAQGMLQAGMANSNLGNYQQSQEQLDGARELFQALGNTSGVVRALGNIANVYSNLGEYVKGLDQFQCALVMFDQLGDRKGAAVSMGNIGSIYARLGEYAHSLEYLQSALALHEQLGDHADMAEIVRVKGNIAGIYRSLGEYDRALEQHQSVLAIHQQRGDRSSMARTIMSIGNVYSDLGKYDRALEQYQSALATYEQLGDRPGIAMVTANIGSLFRSLGEYPKALEHLLSALSLYEQLGSRQGIAHATGNIGELYATKSFEGYDPALAEQYLLRAIDVALEVGAKELLHEFHKILGCLYQQQEKWKQAHHHQAEYYQLKEELQNLEAHKTALQLEHRQQIAQLEKQHAIEHAEAEAGQLRVQLLESQLEHKQQELASTALHLAKQTELLGRFRNDLRQIIRENGDLVVIVKQINEKLKELPCESIDWSKFETEFQQTYPEFERKLLERFPVLTKMEMKICTLLKLRLTSLDIAQLLCKSERSVEWHRLNVRKKLVVARGGRCLRSAGTDMIRFCLIT